MSATVAARDAWLRFLWRMHHPGERPPMLRIVASTHRLRRSFHKAERAFRRTAAAIARFNRLATGASVVERCRLVRLP